jgi:Reverse transcriptase (RNA-dependent DNA polymerase)
VLVLVTSSKGLSSRALTTLTAFVCEGEDLPKTVEQALASPQSEFWRAAMDEEMASLHANGTWELVELPRGVRPVVTRCVFALKRDGAGNVVRFKARLVAKGFTQQEGVDYFETFAPVSKYTGVRVLLALAAAHGWEVQQLDVKTAFLQGDLQEEVYVQQPAGYVDGTTRVCLLRKAFYGLKQAPRAWHEKLHAELSKLGYQVSTADPGLYVCGKEVAGRRVCLLVYVDDMLLVSPSADAVAEAKAALLGIFDARDMGAVCDYVGMRVERDMAAGTITISNERLIKDLLSRFGMGTANSRQTPMNEGCVLSRGEGAELDQRRYQYSSLVGALLYLATTVRPDIAYAVGVLSRFMSCPTKEHWNTAKGVLRYLAGTSRLGITYGASPAVLHGFCDADYGRCIDTRKSTTGYVFTIAGGAVSWSSKKQPTVAASTTEAEYMAASAAVKEALWLRKLLADLGVPVATVLMSCDSTGALTLVDKPVLSERSKHIDVHHHFVRERVALGQVAFRYVHTSANPADMLTKPLGPTKHLAFCSMFGMVAAARS